MPATSRPSALAEIARDLGRSVIGNGALEIRGVASLEAASESDLSFVRSADWRDRALASSAGVLIAPEGMELPGHNVIPSPNPALDFARAVQNLIDSPAIAAGIHSSAVVDPAAKVDRTASLGPRVVVGAGARIGERTLVHANVVVYADVEIGADCTIHSGVILRDGSRLGDRVTLQPGVVVGGDGFGYVLSDEGAFVKIPQVGRVVIEDDVEIGANTTIDRASLDETRIRRGAKIDNLVQIAHNSEIGEDVIVAAQVGLSGHTIVERGAILMGQVGSAGHLRIGERAFVGARAGLHKDVPPGARVFGAPQLEERAWHKAMAALTRLPDALRRLRALERSVEDRKNRGGGDDEE